MTEDWFNRILASAQPLLFDVVECACDAAGKEADYGSEIEFVMASSMCAMMAVRIPEIDYDATFGRTEREAKAHTKHLNDLPGKKQKWGCVFPQVKIENFRVDFLILHSAGLNGSAGIVVECDGHAFHEKTKEQAAKDKARDRALQEAGYRVFHFTGSEIWKDPMGCAEKVLSIAQADAIDAECARWHASNGDLPAALKLLCWPN